MKKILLVEDDVTLHDLYKEALQPHDIELTAVTTGKEGVSLAITNPPDMAILDIMLPGGINGFDVAREIRLHPKTAGIPILILTNLDSERESALAVKAEYLVKTNTPLEAVVQKIREMLKIT